MRLAKNIFYFLSLIAIVVVYAATNQGCAQIGAPTGGLKDTLPPVLVSAVPAERTLNFTGNKIVLTFDEYVDVADVQTNLLVSPYPKGRPTVTNKLKTVTIKLKDSLKANTTYALNFGKAIKDVNEGNVFRNFTYVFSTGNTIDSQEIKGNVILAQTGKVDSTLEVYLYKDAVDSTVKKKKPDYIARVNGKGNFIFRYLPVGEFSMYAIKDDDGSKTYNSKTEVFAFADSIINTATAKGRIKLYAYAEEEKTKVTPKSILPKKPSKDKNERLLRFKTSVAGGASQDLLSPFEIDFSHEVKNIDSLKIRITDTLFNPINTILTIDSTQKKVFLQTDWAENTAYRFIIDSSAVSDSVGTHIAKTDTIGFKTKQSSDYGSLVLRFTNFDAKKHPVLQFVQNSLLVRSVPITATSWNDNLVPPGEYELRVLYDTNNDGVWTPGSYAKKLQPERVISLDKKLTIKADWDNERDVEL